MPVMNCWIGVAKIYDRDFFRDFFSLLLKVVDPHFSIICRYVVILCVQICLLSFNVLPMALEILTKYSV